MLSWRPAVAALLLLTLVPGSAVAEAEKERKNPSDYRIFRFEFDNDSFIGSDEAFSAGWSFQFHSPLSDRWNPAYASWIGKLPGLGDDGEGGRVVRWAYGLSQIILTPTDISIEAPQPNDAPWAGSLGPGSWWSNDNRKFAAIQIYLGCMGPCSHAEQVQKFVREDLGLGESPKGWDNQLSNQARYSTDYAPMCGTNIVRRTQPVGSKRL